VKLQHFLPWEVHRSRWEALKDLVEFYIKNGILHTTITTVEAEFELWRNTCSGRQFYVKDLDSAISFCASAGCFPSISILLEVFITLPTSTASAERSFRSMKYLKDYLRNTMGQERLSDLALGFINQETEITLDDVIKEFSKTNRRLDFGAKYIK
jgi:hypothetical protein